MFRKVWHFRWLFAFDAESCLFLFAAAAADQSLFLYQNLLSDLLTRLFVVVLLLKTDILTEMQIPWK